MHLQESSNEGTETNDGAGNSTHGCSSTSRMGASWRCGAAQGLSIGASRLGGGGCDTTISAGEASARVAASWRRSDERGATVDVGAEDDGRARVGALADNVGVETWAKIGNFRRGTDRGGNGRLRGNSGGLRSHESGLASNNAARARLCEEARLWEGVDGRGRALGKSRSGESGDRDEGRGTHVDGLMCSDRQRAGRGYLMGPRDNWRSDCNINDGGG